MLELTDALRELARQHPQDSHLQRMVRGFEEIDALEAQIDAEPQPLSREALMRTCQRQIKMCGILMELKEPPNAAG